MIIIGIDPGIATIGYGVINYEGNKFTTIDYGAILTPANLPLEKRLLMIFNEICDLVDKYSPAAFAVEELFFNTNQKTAIHVGHGRGVILLAAAQKNVEFFEYTPLQIKQAVVGYGRADKNQVQQMVKVLLNLSAIPKPDDTADALAVAICHAHSAQSRMYVR